MIDFAGNEPYDGRATFEGPDPLQPARTEAWTLSCESPEGTVRSSQQVVVGRGGRAGVDLSGCAAGSATTTSGASGGSAAVPGAGAISPPERCLALDAGVGRRNVGPARLGRTRERQRRALGVATTGRDRYCVQGGGTLRIGYASSRLAHPARHNLRGRAVLIVTSSRGARIGAARPGSRARRPRGSRVLRVGRDTWYLRRTQVVRIRRGKVLEVGVTVPRVARRILGG